MTESERLLHQALARAMGFSSVIWALKRVLMHGLPHAQTAITEESRRMWEHMHRSPESAAWLKLDARGNYAALFSYLSQTAAGDARDSALAALRGSELVFYHALADETALECCKALVAWDWEECSRWVDRRKVEVSDVLSQNREDVVRGALDIRLRELSRESLLAKTDLLYAVCQPEDGWTSLEGYSFSRRRLGALDTRRHEVVHGLSLNDCLNLPEEDLTYLSLTSVHLPQLVMARTGVVIDSEFMSTALKRGFKV